MAVIAMLLFAYLVLVAVARNRRWREMRIVARDFPKLPCKIGQFRGWLRQNQLSHLEALLDNPGIWVFKKNKIALAYLLLNYQNDLNRQRIITALTPSWMSQGLVKSRDLFYQLAPAKLADYTQRSALKRRHERLLKHVKPFGISA